MITSFPIPPTMQGYTFNLEQVKGYWFLPDHPGVGPMDEDAVLEMFDTHLNTHRWREFIRPGSTVIDIGAHCGDTAIPLQLLTRGTVLAVEPNETLYPSLELNCKANSHWGKFIVAREAVTMYDLDEVEILDHGNHAVNGGIIDPTWTAELQHQMRGIHTHTMTVPGLTLEHLCQKYLSDAEIEDISFIKTDTEGHDVSILEFSTPFLDRIRPVIFMEWFSQFGDFEVRRMFAVINAIGYLAFDPRDMSQVLYDQHREGIADLILIHKSKVDKYI